MNYLAIARIVAPSAAILLVLWFAYGFGVDVEGKRAAAEISALRDAHSDVLAALDRTHREALLRQADAARATEQRLVQQMAERDEQFTREIEDAKRQTENELAAVRSGALQLRDRFTCANGYVSADRAAGGTSASPSVGDDAGGTGLQTEDAELLVRWADEADGVVRQLQACQAIVRGDRE